MFSGERYLIREFIREYVPINSLRVNFLNSCDTFGIFFCETLKLSNFVILDTSNELDTQLQKVCLF